MSVPSSYNHVPSQASSSKTTYDRRVLYQNQAGYGQPGKPRRRSRLRLWLIIIAFVAFATHMGISKHASAEALAAQQAQAQAAAEAKHKSTVFSDQVNALIAANPSESLDIATFSSDIGLHSYGDSDPFDGASTAKLLTAADYLHHVEQGTASLQQNIDGQTAQHWLKIMLINSDDTAWAELNGYLTHPDLKAYAHSIGFTDYDPDTNTFTALDIAKLLQKLYYGHLLKPSDRSLMLGYMGQANYRQYIVAAVPEGDTVYHKIGLDDDTVNDSAIITNGQKYLVLVIFTDGNGDYNLDTRAQLIKEIAQDAVAAYL